MIMIVLSFSDIPEIDKLIYLTAGLQIFYNFSKSYIGSLKVSFASYYNAEYIARSNG